MFVIVIFYPAIWTCYKFSYGVPQFDYVGSREPKKRSQNCRTKYVKISKYRSFDCALFCCKHAGGGLEHERSVRGNTRRSRVFHSTSWVLTLTLTLLFFLPRLHSLLALCVRSHHSNLVLLACCFFLSSFYTLSAPHSALEKPVWRRQIYSYMYLGMQISKQGMWNGCQLWIYGRSTFSGKNKTVRGWTSGRSLPVWKFVKYPPEVTTIRLNPSINSNFFYTV